MKKSIQNSITNSLDNDLVKIKKQLDELELEVVIGLETHITITNTKNKLFCSCSNSEPESPNVNTCNTCTGKAGSTPIFNQEIIKEAVTLGKAINSKIAKTISFDRKHYNYPDLPKGYQITQYENPIAIGGEVMCHRPDKTSFGVKLDHFHIEEDPAKLTYTKNKGLLIDFNRSGRPLLEIVTEPNIHNIEDALYYMEALHRLVRNLGISEADMEKGQFKSDISVSLRKKGSSSLNPRTEIKNMNSFKFSKEAIVQEVKHQLNEWSTTGKPKKDQLTVKWDEDTQKVEVMRKKENKEDYGVIPETDIPHLSIYDIVESVFVDPEKIPYLIEKKIINSTNLNWDEVIFFSEDIKKASLLFEVNKIVDDLEFVAKNLMNLLKDDDYNKVDSNVVGELFLSYKNDEYFSYGLLKEIIPMIKSNKDLDLDKFIKEQKTSKDEIVSTIKELEKEKSNKDVFDQIYLGNVKEIGNLIGLISKKLNKKLPGDLVHKIIIETLNLSDLDLEKQKISKSNDRSKIEKNKKNLDIDDYFISETYRSHEIKQIENNFVGKEITLGGWIQSIRDHGDLIFFDLRDGSDIFQVKLSKESIGNLDFVNKFSVESVILCKGIVVERNKEDVNNNLRTGKIELEAKKISLLSKSKPLPFEIRNSHKVNEKTRMSHRYLDLRNEKVKKNIIMRHKVISYIREYLDNLGFIEVETPIIGKASDEGSREFIIPSRSYPGEYYVLPQSPQQLKQILMGSGIDKYYQVARCFRDEDSKGDRQPEFTQLDLEMAFISEKEVRNLITKLLLNIVKDLYPNSKIKNGNIPILSYEEVVERYGSDKPDLRYNLEMATITDILKETDFEIFKKEIENGGEIKCIKVENANSFFSKKYLDDKLRTFAINQGLGGLANFYIGSDNFITEKLGEDIVNKIINKVNGKNGDALLFAAGNKNDINKALSNIREKIAIDYKLFDENELAFCWVVDFPMFEKTDEDKWKFTHNPFSMPALKDLNKHLKKEDIEKIYAQQYDIVLNGNEIGGGSIRAHLPEILKATYEIMGYSPEEIQKSVGHIISAFEYGFPPHGGIALGIDRLLMILQKHSTIREVIAFPKVGAGKDLLMNSPSTLSEEKLKESGLKS